MTVRNCDRCRKERLIYAKGICKSCYQQEVNKRNPNYKKNTEKWRNKNKKYFREYQRMKKLGKAGSGNKGKSHNQRSASSPDKIEKAVLKEVGEFVFDNKNDWDFECVKKAIRLTIAKTRAECDKEIIEVLRERGFILDVGDLNAIKERLEGD